MATTMQPVPGPPPQDMDMAKVGAFMNKAMNDLSGAVASIMCAVGDRLGLFKDLAARGPATSEQLAARMELNPRYVHEWLSVMASAGYVEYDPEAERFTLPVEHSIALAWEGGLAFLGGVYQHLPGLFSPLEQVIEAFKHGGGVSQSFYSDDFREGMERISAGWFENLLVQQWIEAMPALKAKLERGGTVADVGCGSGLALIKMAQAFPNSTFVGYDVFEPVTRRAALNAKRAGVEDRVRFQCLNAVEGLPEKYDLITTFDVMHDIASPLKVLKEFRRALNPDGTYMLVEIKCSNKLEENAGPVGTVLYATSVLYCIPTSIANGGDGLGTMGLPEPKVRDFCLEAGFSSVRRLPVENPFNIAYEIKP